MVSGVCQDVPQVNYTVDWTHTAACQEFVYHCIRIISYEPSTNETYVHISQAWSVCLGIKEQTQSINNYESTLIHSPGLDIMHLIKRDEICQNNLNAYFHKKCRYVVQLSISFTQGAVLLWLIGSPSSRPVRHIVLPGMQLEGLAMLVASIPARFITSYIEISVSITSRIQNSDYYNPRKQDINIDI